MKLLKEYGIITLGVAIIIFAFEFFFFPNQIASGGVSGLALVINNILGIEPGIIMVVCNIILFLLAKIGIAIMITWWMAALVAVLGIPGVIIVVILSFIL